MATFESTGHTVFREGDPAIPDIAAELKGCRPVAHVAFSRGYSARGGTKQPTRALVRQRIGDGPSARCGRFCGGTRARREAGTTSSTGSWRTGLGRRPSGAGRPSARSFRGRAPLPGGAEGRRGAVSEENLEGPDGRGGTVRQGIQTSVPFVVCTREDGVPDVAAFRRYAERVREGLVRSAESRAREARWRRRTRSPRQGCAGSAGWGRS